MYSTSRNLIMLFSGRLIKQFSRYSNYKVSKWLYGVLWPKRQPKAPCKHIGPLGLSSALIQADDPFLIRGRIHSRFSNQTKYFLYILVDRSKTGVDSILEYCCQCKNGLRTVGSCAHIITVLWYLGYARHNPQEIPDPARSLDEFFSDTDSN